MRCSHLAGHPQRRIQRIFESLESRQLLSVSPATDLAATSSPLPAYTLLALESIPPVENDAWDAALAAANASLTAADANGTDGLWNLSDSGYGTSIFAAGSYGDYNGEPIYVGILDSGVDFSHPLLKNYAGTNSDGRPLEIVLNGSNGSNSSGSVNGSGSHGTHVAGIVTAGDQDVRIVDATFLNDEGYGEISDAVRGIRYFIGLREQGVNLRVIVCSWATNVYSEALHQAVLDAGRAGILIVAAAGNGGQNLDINPVYPACDTASNVLTVAAIDANGNLAGFSNYGIHSVDLAAPGVGIYSTGLNGTMYTSSGTSMAAPHVAAVISELWSRMPEATPAQIRAAILAGVKSSPGLSGRIASGGTVDAVGAMEWLGIPKYASPQSGGVTTSKTTVAAGESFAITTTGILVDGGGVATVFYYADTNGNHVLDSADMLLGSSAVNGSSSSATISLDRTGTFTIFAVPVNSVGIRGEAVRTMITVTPRTTSGTMSDGPLLEPGLAKAGVLGRGGTVTFELAVQRGQEYTIRVTLGTLGDSLLTLRSTDGAVLARNDDAAPGTSASKIVWTASQNGRILVEVSSPDGIMSGTFWLSALATSPTTGSNGNSNNNHYNISGDENNGGANNGSGGSVTTPPVTPPTIAPTIPPESAIYPQLPPLLRSGALTASIRAAAVDTVFAVAIEDDSKRMAIRTRLQVGEQNATLLHESELATDIARRRSAGTVVGTRNSAQDDTFLPAPAVRLSPHE